MHLVHGSGRQRMDLDQLRYFLRVAQRQNFTRAAEDLGISQPALSRSIQKLEEEFGQPVFETKDTVRSADGRGHPAAGPSTASARDS